MKSLRGGIQTVLLFSHHCMLWGVKVLATVKLGLHSE